MQKRYLLESDSSRSVEVTIADADGPIDASAASRLKTATETFDSVLDAVVPQLQATARSLQRVGADTVSVELGLKLGGEAGVMVLKAAAEADIRVTLTWNRVEPKDVR